MEYVNTGIDDFDSMFSHGGYPRGRQILVLGGPGSGKSIFTAQYLHSGITKFNEPGVYVALEETPSSVISNMNSFGWDFKALESEGKLKFIDSTSLRAKGGGTLDQDMLKESLDVDNLSIYIEHAIDEIGAKRLVIDSISMMGLHTKDEFTLRSKLLNLSLKLSTKGVTSLLISEARRKDVGLEDYPVEMFMFDGVIALLIDSSTKERKISIIKMRGTKHVIGSFKFRISDHGFEMAP